MIWNLKRLKDIKNAPLSVKKNYVDKKLWNWGKLLEWDLSSFQKVEGFNDWNSRNLYGEDSKYHDQGFEIINFVSERKKHIGFVIKNPNFNCFVMVYDGGVYSTGINSSCFDDKDGNTPDFVKNWVYNWVIDNEVLLENQFKDIKLESYREKWGVNFIEELGVNEASLFKTRE